MRALGPDARADRIVGGLLLLVLAGITAWRGGFSEQSRGALFLLAGLLLIVAASVAPGRLRAALRAPLVAALLALAVASALSAAWTIGSADDALRAGATIAGYGVLVAVGASLSTPRAMASILLVVAVAAAVIGLAALGAGHGRWVVEVCGTLRPAGPFEYPPALALLCAGALAPAVLLGLARDWRAAAAGGAAVVVLATTVAFAGNRTAVALAVGVLLTSACVPLPAGLPSRGARSLAALAAIVAGLAIALRAGPAPADPHTGWLGIVGTIVLATVLWAVVAGRVRRARGGRWVLVVLAVAGLAGIAASVASERNGGCATTVQNDQVVTTSLTHGRVDIWRAAWETGRGRPLDGYGAGSFLVATGARQIAEGRPVPTSFAHDLPLEQWAELGLIGALLALAVYASTGLALVRASPEALVLLGPFVAAFALANLVDWPWHLSALSALWAAAAGGLVGARRGTATAERDRPAEAGLPESIVMPSS